MSESNLSRRSIGEKLVLAGGAAALTMASGNPAQTAIVQSLTTPVSPESSWDVDADSTPEFSATSFFSLRSLNEIGGRFVAPNWRSIDGFAKLASGFQVGASMPGFKFFNTAQNPITVSAGSNIGGDLGAQGWSKGETGFFGFKFTNGTGTHYGWGEITLPLGNSPFAITKAYYETTPDTPILVGATGVPEPSTCALALLAAGGVAAYKGRRKQAAV